MIGLPLTSLAKKAATVADLAERLAIEAELAREAWDEAQPGEQQQLAGVLLLGLVPMGVRDLGEALLTTP
jgi:hypothetical protein